MKNKIYFMVLISVFSIMLVLCFFGCDSEYIHTIPVPETITYHGKTYENTEEVVAKETIPDEVSYSGEVNICMGDTPTPTFSPAVPDERFTNFEIYTIKDIDEDQSIAVKTISVSEKSRCYVYLKYDNVQNKTDK